MTDEGSSRLRVAISASFWGQETTGSGQYLHHLAAALAELADGPEISLCGPPALRQLHPLPARAAWYDVVSGGLWQNWKNPQKLWFEQVSFPKAAREDGAQVAHVPYFAPPLSPTLPTVVTIHDLIPLLLPAYRTSWSVRAYMALVARAARRATLILTDSEAARRDVIEHLRIPAQRVHAIPLATTALFHPLPEGEAQARVRERFALPENYFLYLGGFDERKNLPLLFQALAEARRRLPELPILAVGGTLPQRDTAFAPDPRRLAAEAGVAAGVRFLGRVAEEDKPILYGGAVAFLFPSRYEGFGLPVLEALACGVPVACASTTSLPEVAGPGALLLPPHDVASWAEALTHLASDPALRTRLREAGLRHAANFRWERTARETAAAYRQALAFHGGRPC